MRVSERSRSIGRKPVSVSTLSITIGGGGITGRVPKSGGIQLYFTGGSVRSRGRGILLLHGGIFGI